VTRPAAELDELVARLDVHPTPVLHARVRSVVGLVDLLDARLARAKGRADDD
jgi:hypothetical protein